MSYLQPIYRYNPLSQVQLDRFSLQLLKCDKYTLSISLAYDPRGKLAIEGGACSMPSSQNFLINIPAAKKLPNKILILVIGGTAPHAPQ